MARRVASTPIRTAAQTWERIVEIVAPDPKSPARAELAKASSVACSAIASEATKDAAIVIWGNGPRVRVYCVFDEDAITQDDVNEDSLPKPPTEGDWNMSMPCLPEDVKWSAAKLGAGRIVARSIGRGCRRRRGEDRGRGRRAEHQCRGVSQVMSSSTFVISYTHTVTYVTAKMLLTINRTD